MRTVLLARLRLRGSDEADGGIRAGIGETVQNDASWARTRKSNELIDEYIEPCLSSFEKLADLKRCCTEEDSYMKLIIHDEHAKEFSVLVLNAPKAELFYFTLH